MPAGDSALSVILGDAVDRAVSQRVLALGERLMRAGRAGLIEVVPGMAALTVQFDPDMCDAATLTPWIASLAAEVMAAAVAPRHGRRWTIPACYDPSLALDIEDVAARCGLDPDEIVRRHTGRDYHVYMLGFLPGFPYMGDLDSTMHLPRRANPRVEVPAGSVAIAAAMTAIYPTTSPGGWHIIGRTPVPLFDVAADPPAVFSPGDVVRFDAVGRDEFERIAAEVRSGGWRLMPEAEGG